MAIVWKTLAMEAGKRFVTWFNGSGKTQMFKWFNERRAANRRIVAKALLTKLIADKDPEIYEQLRTVARYMAAGTVMAILDQKRINHCKVCPTTDQLVNFSGVYYCKRDVPNTPEQQPAPDVVK